MAVLKIRPYKKVYTDDEGEKVNLQPIVCSACGYDSAMDEIESHNFCPNCGEEIEGIIGNLLPSERF